MREISVKITSKSLSKLYTINLDDEFAKKFEKEWEILTGGDRFLDAGDLLKAFIQKSYENFLQTQELENLIKKINIDKE